MKKYSIKVFLSFIIIFAVLFFIVTFFYTNVTKRFLTSKITENTLYMNETMTQRVDYAINHDIMKLKEIVNNSAVDKIAENLLNNKVLAINPIGYGIVEIDNFLIEGIKYYYNNDYLDTVYFENQFDDYHQQVAIYRFKNDLNESYVFFNLDNHLVYYDAHDYFKELLEDPTYLPKNYYFILSKDGVVHFQKDSSQNDKFFNHYLRNENANDLVEEVLFDLQQGKSNITSLNLFHKKVYLAYSPLDLNLNARAFYLTYAYDSDDVNISMAYLTRALLTLALFIILSFIIVSLAIYYLVMVKNSDIELSKLRYYYLKPLVLKINRLGKFKSMNRTIKIRFPELKGFRHLTELPIIDLNGELFTALNKQMPFTIMVKANEINKFIRFVPIKALDGYYLIGEDITDYENEHLLHKELALYNHVTKYPNHIVLRHDLTNITKMKDEAKGYSLIIIDIVNFKNFNKLFGRVMGDELLVAFSKLIIAQIDASDYLYNFSADEFGLLIKDESKERAETLINKLKEALKRPFDINNNQLVIDIKAGIFHFTGRTDLSPSSIYENAYMALKLAKGYDAKSIATYDESFSQFITKEQVLIDDLQYAINHHEFVLFLQPQFNNETNNIVAFEALIRWDNPKYRLQSPAHFIEVAEQNNMIIQIGSFVIKETFRIAKLLESYNVRISMNVSPIQLIQAGFVNEMISQSEMVKLKRGSVAIEITETVLVSNFEVVTKKLELLKEYGFSIHLDDFGTGYSSLLYLKNLPIDTIKIDREFIRYLSTDKYSRAIVSKIISLTKNIDLAVIAEGVEDAKQNQFLMKSGCNIIQGHLISPAVPLNEAIKLIEQYNLSEKTIKPKK